MLGLCAIGRRFRLKSLFAFEKTGRKRLKSFLYPGPSDNPPRISFERANSVMTKPRFRPEKQNGAGFLPRRICFNRIEGYWSAFSYGKMTLPVFRSAGVSTVW